MAAKGFQYNQLYSHNGAVCRSVASLPGSLHGVCGLFRACMGSLPVRRPPPQKDAAVMNLLHQVAELNYLVGLGGKQFKRNNEICLIRQKIF